MKRILATARPRIGHRARSPASPPPPTPVRRRRPRHAPAPRQGALWERSASTPPAWTPVDQAPGDDFYGFANGTWAKTTPIPADKSNYGAFDTRCRICRMLAHPRYPRRRRAGDPASQDRPRLCQLSRHRRDRGAKGLAPIKPWLGRIKPRSTDKAGYPALLAEADRDGVRGPFSGGVGQDAKNPDDLCRRAAPIRPRPARPRLLPQRRSQARRGEGRLSGVISRRC